MNVILICLIAYVSMKKMKQFNHFIQRMKERYDLDLDITDLYEIAKLIKCRKAKLVRVNSKAFLYKVRYRRKLFIVVLDFTHSAFITVLPITKKNDKVTFKNRTYDYLDALYITYQFNKCYYFKNNRPICPNCGCKHIISPLGKNRFQCEKCHHIIFFKELEKPELFLANDNYNLNLSIDTWWYFTINNICVSIFDTYELKAEYDYNDNDIEHIFVLYDTSKVLNNKIILQLGKYTPHDFFSYVQQLRKDTL